MTAAIGAPQPFVPPFENTNKDIGTIFKEFMDTQLKNIIKIFGYATGWTSIYLGKGDPTGELCGRISGHFQQAKRFATAMEIPAKTYEVGVAVEKLIKTPSLENMRNLFLDKLTSLIDPVCNAIEFGNEYLPLEQGAFTAMKAVNYGSTFIGNTNGIVKEAEKMYGMPEFDTKKATLHLINIARNVSYVVLGAIGLASVFLGFAAMPWMFLACLTSGLTFTLGGFFYERLVYSEKNLNIDFEKVNANLNREVVHLRPAAAA